MYVLFRKIRLPIAVNLQFFLFKVGEIGLSITKEKLEMHMEDINVSYILNGGGCMTVGKCVIIDQQLHMISRQVVKVFQTFLRKP